MAGGRNVPDIGVQHPSNQNMMQMDNGGTKGVNLPNSPDVPQGIQNQAHPTQPGTAITQPSQPGQPYNNQPNQVNPNTQPNAPGSTQNTPLQNNTRTVQSSQQQPYYTSSTGNTQKFNLTRQDIPFSNQQLTNASKLPKVNKLTAAGHAYQKHSHGPGANPNLPRIGSFNKMNEEGEKFVQFILDHPQAFFVRNVVNGIQTYEIRVPNLGGVEFDINGNFKGFLNP